MIIDNNLLKSGKIHHPLDHP